MHPYSAIVQVLSGNTLIPMLCANYPWQSDARGSLTLKLSSRAWAQRLVVSFALQYRKVTSLCHQGSISQNFCKGSRYNPKRTLC